VFVLRLQLPRVLHFLGEQLLLELHKLLFKVNVLQIASDQSLALLNIEIALVNPSLVELLPLHSVDLHYVLAVSLPFSLLNDFPCRALHVPHELRVICKVLGRSFVFPGLLKFALFAPES
jgi:hypothetical protein